jgi:hypothetical protein
LRVHGMCLPFCGRAHSLTCFAAPFLNRTLRTRLGYSGVLAAVLWGTHWGTAAPLNRTLRTRCSSRQPFARVALRSRAVRYGLRTTPHGARACCRWLGLRGYVARCNNTGCMMLRVARCMLHAAFCTLHVACCILQVACCSLHFTRRMLQWRNAAALVYGACMVHACVSRA